MKKILLTVCLSAFVLGTYAQPFSYGVKGGFNYSKTSIGVDHASLRLNSGWKNGFYLGGLVEYNVSPKFSVQAELLYSYDGSRLTLNTDFISDLPKYDWFMNEDGTGIMSSLTGFVNQYAAFIDPNHVALDDQQAFGFLNNMIGDRKLGGALTYHNIRIPILAKFKPGGKFNVMAGPYFSYRVTTSGRASKDLTDLYDGIRTIGNTALTAMDASLSGIIPEMKDLSKVVAQLAHKNLKKFEVGVTLGAEYFVTDNIFVDVRWNFGLCNLMKDKISLDSKELRNIVGNIAGNQTVIGMVDGMLFPGAMAFITDEVNKKGEIKISEKSPVSPSVKYSSLMLGVGFKF